MQTIVKQPAESRTYGIDFSQLLTLGDTLTSVTSLYAVPTGLTLGLPSVSGTSVDFNVSSGEDGTTYHITALVLTAGGDSVEGDGYLYVIDAANLISTVPTLVSSWGGDTSNAYVSLTAANSWITNNVFGYEAWTSASYDKRALALTTATRQIDAKQYIYDRKYTDQLLEFPRGLDANFRSGVLIDSSVSDLEERMQFDIERACCLQALHVLKMVGTSEHATNIAAGVKSVTKSAGPISETYNYGNPDNVSLSSLKGGKNNPLCEEALEYLRDWMTSRRIFRG